MHTGRPLQERGRVLSSRNLGALVMSEVSYAHGSFHPTHAHDVPYLNIVTAGSYREEARGERRTCRLHSVVFRPAGEPHETRFDAGDVRCLAVRFDADWIAEAVDGPLPDRSVDLGLGPARWLGSRLFARFRSAPETSPEELEEVALELLRSLVRRAGPSSGAAPRWLSYVLRRIGRNPTGCVLVRDLAREVGVHPFYLGRVFHAHVGVPVTTYVRRLRVERAGMRLRQTPETVAAIAQATGFADQSHLCRSFRDVTGMTPSEYRRAFGAGPSSPNPS